MLLRVTQVALVLNAVLHGIASAGMALGFGPHAAGQATMAHRAAAAGVAACFMLAFVARRLLRDAGLIALPIAFVLLNLVDSLYELVSSGDTNHMAPAAFEAVFLSIYVAFAVNRRRAPRLA